MVVVGKYAGIGHRDSPDIILELMRHISVRLLREGFLMRSGGARGADRAFAALLPPDRKEVFGWLDARGWALEYAGTHCMPVDRKNFHLWKPYARGLIGRNMMQVLGENGDDPVDMVICYARSFTYEKAEDSGGTGYAVRCAILNQIPVFNLYSDDTTDRMLAFLDQDVMGFREFFRPEMERVCRF